MRAPAMTGLIHKALMYESEPEFVAAAVNFIQDGEALGEPTMAVVSRRKIEMLRAATTATVEYIDAEGWYTSPGATLGAYYRRVQQHRGPGRLRLVGEPIWTGRSPLQVREWKRYEAVANLTFASCPAWILCPYDTGALPDDIVAAASCTHPDVVVGGVSHRSAAYQDPAEFARSCDRTPLAPPGADVAALPIIPGGLTRVRGFLAAESTLRGLGGDRMEDLVIAANEAATNVVEHGGRRGRVRIWTDHGDLVCDVVDEGGRLDDPLAGHLPPPPRATSGHGLWLIRQLCDLVEIRDEPGGVIVRMRMHLS
ncbi:sensor histidine kinase [Actinomadura barringtoniae]|uniref:Sensor histidine kinase n=1 Tax=Actinomadura barringtoniae TaxID=1427535 RepID=A0A939PA89_9ACTN|nr:sensor histidine kinase [Actinomadura barringtoniae]MBO2448830.1 sensor histidine kinase [Actinomadura barringtoniae]